jgi:hypothetical protein
MQRDMHLLRALCLTIERGGAIEQDERAAYHLDLLLQGGLVTADIWEAGARRVIDNPRLTPAGHDFVDLARDDATWQAVKDRVQSTVGTTSFANWLDFLEAAHRGR